MNAVEPIEPLWDEHYRTIECFVAKRVQADDVSDLVQEIFIKAHTALKRDAIQPNDGLVWLYRIARNHVIDHYRARTRRPIVGLDEFSEYLYSDSLEDTLDQMYDSELVQKSLRQLASENQRTILEMRMEGYKLEECAEELGITIESVKMLQHRGFAAMRATLDPKHAVQPDPCIRLSAPAQRIQAALSEIGPSTVGEIAKATNMQMPGVNKMLQNNRHAFRIVEHREKGRITVRVWGLVQP